MARQASINDIVKVEGKSNPLPLGWQYYFETQNGEEVNVPIGSTLHFSNGFAVRQYDLHSGAGMYGYPPNNFWTVTVQERNGQVGFLFSDMSFIPLHRIRDGLAEIKSLAT